MKMIESADGSIKVIELDPTKMYWIFIDPQTAQFAHRWVKKDGMIYVIPKNARVEIVENAGQIEGVKIE